MSSLKTQIIQIEIGFISCYCGIPLTNLHLPPKCFLVGIIRRDKLILVNEQPTIHYGDTILAIALNSTNAPALKAFLKKAHPVFWSGFSCPWPKDSRQPDQESISNSGCQDAWNRRKRY